MGLGDNCHWKNNGYRSYVGHILASSEVLSSFYLFHSFLLPASIGLRGGWKWIKMGQGLANPRITLFAG